MGYVPPEDDVYEVEEGVEAKPLEELQYMDFTTDGYWGDEMSGQVEKDEEMPADVTERRRRSQNLPKKNRKRLLTLLTDEDDRVPRIRYEAPMQAGDKREAFHEPYIPPQWKEPGVNASIPRTRHRRGNRT